MLLKDEGYNLFNEMRNSAGLYGLTTQLRNDLTDVYTNTLNMSTSNLGSAHTILKILNIFLSCSTKTDTQIKNRVHHFTRIDTEQEIITTIKSTITRGDTHLLFIEKTQLSQRAITRILDGLHDNNCTITEKTEVSTYLSLFDVRCFHIQETQGKNTCYLFIGKTIPCKAFYTAVGMLPKWYPNIFKKETHKYMDVIVDCCKAIAEMDEIRFINNINKLTNDMLEVLATQNNIDYNQLAKALIAEKNRKNELEAEIINKQRLAAHTWQNYLNTLCNIENLNKALTDLITQESKIDNEETLNELKAFKSIKAFGQIKADPASTRTYLTLTSKCIPSNKELAEKIFTKPITAENYNCYTNAECKLMLDILVNDKYTIDFTTAFKVPYTQRIEQADGIYTKNSIPNPHLRYHSCFGSNAQVIAKAQASGNIIDTIGALTACNSNLNTEDSVVLKEFTTDLLKIYKDKPILYNVENKKYYTVTEAIELNVKEAINKDETI